MTWEEFDQIEGWLNQGSFYLWKAFLSFQNKKKIQGHMVEIGVWKGRGAALMNSFRTPNTENLMLVDIRLKKNDILKSLGVDYDFIEENINMHQCNSILLSNSHLLDKVLDSRWFHIDGDHTASGVYYDLLSAHKVLGTNGILCIDNFFDLTYPQITISALQFLATVPHSFCFLLVGYNKGYFCRPQAYQMYSDYIVDQLGHDLKTVFPSTIFKSSSMGDSYTFGITPYDRRFGLYSGLEDTFKNQPDGTTVSTISIARTQTDYIPIIIGDTN